MIWLKMSPCLKALLLGACIFTNAHAQFGLTAKMMDPEWLTDDPHKADRLPVWNQLLGNRGFHFGTQAAPRQTHAPRNTGWGYATKNTGNNWNQALQNMYRVMIWRQVLNNLSRAAASLPSRRAASTAPSRTIDTASSRVTYSNTPVKGTNNVNKKGLQNFLQIVLLNKLLGNHKGGNSNAS